MEKLLEEAVASRRSLLGAVSRGCQTVDYLRHGGLGDVEFTLLNYLT